MKLPISPEQAAVLIVVNFIGLSCFGLIFYIMQRKHENKNQKIKAAIELGLISLLILVVIFADMGIYYWVKSNDFRAALIVLPLLLCITPVFFLTVSLGAYIQLAYRDKIESIVKSTSNNKSL